MDEFDFPGLLDDGDAPEASPDVLRRIVARNRHRQVRRYRAVATSVVVLALVGAATGLGLTANGGGGTKSALSLPAAANASGQPPAGLRWDSAAPGVAVPAASRGFSGAALPAAQPSLPSPGEFGFANGAANSSLSSHGAPNALPAATGTNAGGGFGFAPVKECRAESCSVVYEPRLPEVLFRRHVDGLTITVSVLQYWFPVALHRIGGGLPQSSRSSTTNTAVATPATTSTGKHSASSLPARLRHTLPLLPVVSVCPVSSEFVVSVVGDGSYATLFVPTGGPSDEPFSVVASAAARVGRGHTVVLAVARTSPGVASVSARFASGASDAMAPRGGWVALAEVIPSTANLASAGAVHLVATSASGKVLEEAVLPASGALATAPLLACRYLISPENGTAEVTSPPAPVSGGSGTGSASGSTGSSGSAGSSGSRGSSGSSGSAGTGSAGTGSVSSGGSG